MFVRVYACGANCTGVRVCVLSACLAIFFVVVVACLLDRLLSSVFLFFFSVFILMFRFVQVVQTTRYIVCYRPFSFFFFSFRFDVSFCAGGTNYGTGGEGDPASPPGRATPSDGVPDEGFRISRPGIARIYRRNNPSPVSIKPLKMQGTNRSGEEGGRRACYVTPDLS